MLIVQGRYVLTEDGLMENHCVVVEDGIIEKVLPTDQVHPHSGDEVLKIENGIITPGFINAHTHMYGTVAHGIHTEKVIKDFTDFLEVFWWPMVEDQIDHELIRATTAWACIESIDSGVTTLVDTLEAPNSLPGCLAAEAEVLESYGVRGYLSFEASQRKDAETAEAGLAENITFARSREADDLVQGFLSIHTLFTCDQDYVKKARAMAREAGCLFHMHLSESDYEPAWSEERYGKRPAEVYKELGALDHDVLASQVVQVSEAEKKILAGKDVAMVHMPLSNCEVGGGVAPFPDFLKMGARVALGTDGYINNFFEVMRGAFLIHKAYRRDPQVMKAQEVFEMATWRGADAIGRKDLGRIAPGARADLITIRLDTPTPITVHNLYEQLVLYRNPHSVRDVVINGKILKRDGILTKADVQAVKEKLRTVTGKLWDKQ